MRSLRAFSVLGLMPRLMENEIPEAGRQKQEGCGFKTTQVHREREREFKANSRLYSEISFTKKQR